MANHPPITIIVRGSGASLKVQSPKNVKVIKK